MNQETLKAGSQFKRLTGITPKIDGMLSAAAGKIIIDIFQLEKDIVSHAKKEYDSNNCIYDGKPGYSLAMVIEEEWGEEAKELLFKL